MTTTLIGTAREAAIDKVPEKASLLRFNFRGKVTAVENSYRILDDSVKAGTLFKGSYTYSANTANNDIRTHHGLYGGLASSLNIGKYEFLFNNLTIRVSNSIRDKTQECLVDALDILSVTDEINDISKIFSINLVDKTSTALTSNELPLAPPDLSLFDTTDSFFLSFDINSGQRFATVYGDIYSIELATPSPTYPLQLLKLLRRWAS